MATGTLRTLEVMLSSRVDDPKGELPDGTKLREVRDRLTADLQATLFTDDPLFNVWVNEASAALSGELTVEEHCRQKVDEADIVLVLYNGRAGWASQGLQGICHTELQAARDRAPHKVRVVQLPMVDSTDTLDIQFQEYVAGQAMWTSPPVDTYDGILEQSHRALRHAVAEMTHAQALQGSRRGVAMRGEALRWRRLDYRERAELMRTSASKAFLASAGSKDAGRADGAHLVKIDYASKPLLLRIDAVPAAMTVAAAREMVGQPFLRDHQLAGQLPKGGGGPVHVIVCQGSVSESQAVRQLGFPDAMLVPADFGVYVADEVQKVQIVFLRYCTSSDAIRLAVQTLLAWLDESEEGDRLVGRAVARAQVVKLLASLKP